MKYPYIVIHNGKWYNAGEEVPESNSPVSSVGYTKTEINRMSTADLQKLAAEQGIENAQATKIQVASGAELKEILIAKFNL